ncbi:hypothetical protein H311_00706 [Anncaliia algerae PRA109]|nr:hypothetical protein H311_00706 [Anncaliia algerae PRA109]
MLEKIPITFKRLNQIFKVFAIKNETILECTRRNKVPLEGACEGSLACSTCHVIIPKNIYNKLPEPSDREYDMLDQAFGLTDTSRLGCQVKITELMKNSTIELPRATRNLAVDGFIPTPH